jgi:hypothetical protein
MEPKIQISQSEKLFTQYLDGNLTESELISELEKNNTESYSDGYQQCLIDFSIYEEAQH